VLTTHRRVRPELGKSLAERNDFGAQTRIEPVGLGRRSGFPPRERLLGPAQLRERGLPEPLEARLAERVDPDNRLVAAELVAETVDLLRFGALQGLVGLTLRLARETDTSRSSCGRAA
jgi:hypothetical protein